MNPTSYNESIVNNTLLGSMQSVASYGSQNMSGSQFIGNVFNNALMIGGSVKMSANVTSGDTSGVGFAGASIDGSLPPSPDCAGRGADLDELRKVRVAGGHDPGSRRAG